jgi:protein TonB
MEGIMFQGTLLESARAGAKRKRWPMVLAVALEVTVGGVLITLPLLSTGIIPVSARTPLVAPRLERVTIIDDHPTGPTGSHEHCAPVPQPTVVTFGDSRPVIDTGRSNHLTDDESNLPPNIIDGSSGNGPPRCDICLSTPPPRPQRPIRKSEMDEGQLLNKIEPVYPRIASLTNIHGEVRLHAIIARDGTIQSLSVISGHPILAKAAMEAVRQWRYRPYVLNKEPVEVDTFITVNFRNDR